jgi:hypothetical protein
MARTTAGLLETRLTCQGKSKAGRTVRATAQALWAIGGTRTWIRRRTTTTTLLGSLALAKQRRALLVVDARTTQFESTRFGNTGIEEPMSTNIGTRGSGNGIGATSQVFCRHIHAWSQLSRLLNGCAM